MSVNIPDNIIKRVLKVMGYPAVSLDDFAETMSMDDLKELILQDMFTTFFGFFPKKLVQEIEVGRTFEIDFPTDDTYTLLDYRVALTQNAVTGRTGNVFLDAVSTTQSQGMYGGAFGTKYNYDMDLSRSFERLSRQGIIDTDKYVRVNILKDEQKITGYTSFPGKLNLTWGLYSYDWNDIPYSFQTDCIELMQSLVMEYFGTLRSQLAEGSPINFDYDTMLQQAEDKKEKIIEKWKSKPKIVVLRS